MRKIHVLDVSELTYREAKDLHDHGFDVGHEWRSSFFTEEVRAGQGWPRAYRDDAKLWSNKEGA